MSTRHIRCCSCDDHTDHVVGRRTTADGKRVSLWSDGSLPWALGYAIRGSAHPRTEGQRSRALTAGWLVLGEVCLYDASEVSGLISAARWSADRDGSPGTMRARLHRSAAPKPVWEVLQTDRDGRPTSRVWRLPRIQFPGVAIWHERGTYEVMHEIGHTGTFSPTGIRSKTLRGVWAQLTSKASL